MTADIEQQIEARCPCFAMLASECTCEPAELPKQGQEESEDAA